MSKFAWGLVTAGVVACALFMIGTAAYAQPISISMGDASVGIDTRHWTMAENTTDCECTGCYIYVGPFYKRWG